MRILLPLIRAALQQGLTQLPRRSDCYVTPHANYMPTGTRQPSLGIKDGGVGRREQTCGVMELSATVELVGFVRMSADGEAAMCSDDGVMALLDDAVALLAAHADTMDGVQGFTVGADRPSEMYQADNNQWLVKLVRTVTYTIER